MNLFGIFRHRGDPDAPGPHIIAGVLPPRERDIDVVAMRMFGLPQMGNIVNLDYHRLHRGTQAAFPLRGTRVKPDGQSVFRPAPIASQQSGEPQTLLMSTAQTSRSVQQPERAVPSIGRSGSNLPEGA